MVDSKEIIHARSILLSQNFHKLGKGSISLVEMLSFLAAEEEKANLAVDKKTFFAALRELALKVDAEDLVIN